MAEQSRKKVFLVGLALAAIIFPVVPLLDHLGRPELIYPVVTAFVAIAVAMRARWELRGQLWFWTTITVIASLHVPLILLIPWTAGWIPAPVTKLFCIVDLVIIYAIIGFIEKLNQKLRRTGRPTSPA